MVTGASLPDPEVCAVANPLAIARMQQADSTSNWRKGFRLSEIINGVGPTANWPCLNGWMLVREKSRHCRTILVLLKAALVDRVRKREMKRAMTPEKLVNG